MIITITGPSGVGKSTISKKLAEKTSYKETISCTTRSKRDGEVDGVDYYFITREKFLQHIDDNEFIEYAEFNNNLYGTLIKELNHENVIAVLETEGVRQLKQNIKHDTVFSIYMFPPNINTLIKRLGLRYADNDPEFISRVELLKSELLIYESNKKLFDYYLANNILAETILKIIRVKNSFEMIRRLTGF